MFLNMISCQGPVKRRAACTLPPDVDLATHSSPFKSLLLLLLLVVVVVVIVVVVVVSLLP